MTTNKDALDAYNDIRGRIYSYMAQLVKDKDAPVWDNVKNDLDTIRTALTQPNQALVEALENAKNMCEAIVNGYPNQNINHVDFRVQVTKWAQDFLDDDVRSIPTSETTAPVDKPSPSDQVEVDLSTLNQELFDKIPLFWDASRNTAIRVTDYLKKKGYLKNGN